MLNKRNQRKEVHKSFVSWKKLRLSKNNNAICNKNEC